MDHFNWPTESQGAGHCGTIIWSLHSMCGPWIDNTSITWELIKDTDSEASLQFNQNLHFHKTPAWYTHIVFWALSESLTFLYMWIFQWITCVNDNNICPMISNNINIKLICHYGTTVVSKVVTLFISPVNYLWKIPVDCVCGIG